MGFERGTVIAGKYRVERVLGEGGMGVVLAARHLGLDEMVAVKLIREERASGEGALARFQREARAAARIKSEHVARVLDVDRLPDGDPYIVMELIDGTDLHALVESRGSLPPDEAVTYVIQACEGLAEAHALGMVHRDLKLKNLFLTKRRDGRPLIKVIDFGVVKFSPIPGDDDDDTLLAGSISALGRVRARDATLTGASVLVGSVHYMAPEQIRASNVVDPRADVWSLGVCLYAMLTGALPFEGHTVGEVCAAIQGRPAPDLRIRAPHVPPGLAAAVTHALEKDPRRRFTNVAELSAALAPFHADPAALARIETILESSVRARGALDAPAVMPPAPAAGGFLGRVESTIDAAAVGSLPSTSEPAPRRGRWLTGGLVLVAASAATVLVWTRRPEPSPTRDPSTTTLAAAAAAATAAPASAATMLPVAEPVASMSSPSSAPPASASGAPAAPVAARPAAKRPAARPSKVGTPPATGAPAAAAAPAAAPPKAETTSAYDHF